MSSQVSRLKGILRDRQPHSVKSLLAEIYDSTGPTGARLSARVQDVNDWLVKNAPDWHVNGWWDNDEYYYQLIQRKVEPVQEYYWQK